MNKLLLIIISTQTQAELVLFCFAGIQVRQMSRYNAKLEATDIHNIIAHLL